MPVNSVMLKINFNNNKEQLNFSYSYNNYTKYQDLLEYISFLYPEYNICPCFCFSNNSYYLNNDILIVSNNDINGFLKLSNDFGCRCSDNLKKLYRQRKVDIINAFKKPNNELQKEIKEENQYLKNKNKELEKKNKLLREENQKLKNKNKDLEIQITKIKEENQKLIVKNNELESNKNEKANLIMKLQNDKKSLEMAVNNKNPRKDVIRINLLNNQLIGNNYVENTKFEDFYDVIIDIKSIKDINKG